MICCMKLTPESIDAFFDAKTAKKRSEFSENDLSFISGQNSNSGCMRFNKQFLSGLLTEAEQFGLTAARAGYCAGDIRLLMSHSDPNYWRMPGGLSIVLNRMSTVFVTSLTVNDFKIRRGGENDEEYVADYYSQFDKTALKKAGWRVCEIAGKTVWASGAMPDFKLAWFKNWISKTAKIRDSIEEAEHAIEKRKRISAILFADSAGHVDVVLR